MTCLITLDKAFSFQPHPTEEGRKEGRKEGRREGEREREGGAEREGKRGPYRTGFICCFFLQGWAFRSLQVALGGHKIQLHICSAFPLHCVDLCAGDV